MEKRQIIFDEAAHRYTDEHSIVYTSVTQLISKVDPEYDAEFWAMYRAVDQVGHYSPRPFPETRHIEVSDMGSRIKYPIHILYSGVIPLSRNPNDIRAEWEAECAAACARGNDRHGYLENCINKISSTRDIVFHDIQVKANTQGFAFKVTNLDELAASPLAASYPTIYAHIKRLIEDGWVAYAEKRVYNAEYQVAGTIDLLFVKGDHIYIMDWKTNKKPMKFVAGYYAKEWNAERTKKIETSRFVTTNAKLLYPLGNVAACKGSIYTLQLSLYIYLCELWGYKSAGSVLCHIRPVLNSNKEVEYNADGSYVEHEPEFYQLRYMKDEVIALLKWHKQFCVTPTN